MHWWFFWYTAIRYVGVWRSLVARLLWEQDVAGSNPVTPTTLLLEPLSFRQGLVSLGGSEKQNIQAKKPPFNELFSRILRLRPLFGYNPLRIAGVVQW